VKKKLSLDLADLRVETFEPATPARKSRGTVRGQLDTDSCPGYSCAVTCGIAISPGTAAEFQHETFVDCPNSFQVCCV
jgi:hypothetical protein